MPKEVPPGASTGTYLDEIVSAHRARVASDRRDPHALLEQAEQAVLTQTTRGFADRIADSAGLAVIAEIKRRSPSKGDIAPDLDPAVVAREYESGGATCISVLTDEGFFAGSTDDLVAAREACALPVLRKDFTVSDLDLCDARLMGADAVLIIAAVLSDDELGELHTLARELALDALVEVHDEHELERALEAGAELVGVNQRDLRTFEVDTGRAARIAAHIPAEVIAVAESGIAGPDDAKRLADSGYQAILVGESLLRASDHAAAVASLAGHAVGTRSGQGAASAAER